MADDVALLALIPAWNEAPRIGSVLKGVSAYLPVLVVDDGSTDDTAALAESTGAYVVRHERNLGKGAALMTGFTWALERGYDAVLTLDADGQHDPADIPKFIAAYRENAGDLIIGRRDFNVMPFPRHYTNPLGSWLLSRALRMPILDNQSGYRLYTRRLLEALLPVTALRTASGFEWEVEVITQAVCRGLTIAWVDIRTIYGIDKASYFHPLKDTVVFLGMVWRAYRERRRCASERLRQSS